MDGILVFDGLNDVIYMKLNQQLHEKLKNLAISKGFLEENEVVVSIHSNIIMQIFQPLITSQRVMLCQFDNAYSSIQCENNFNIVFQEFLGYSFLKIGDNDVELLRKSMDIFISFIKRICGPNVHLIKTDETRKTLIARLYESWQELYKTDQTVLVEAVEALLVSSEIRLHALQGLQAASEKLKQDPYSQRNHTLLFVNNKLLSLYSSRQSQPLSPTDSLFISLFHTTITKNVGDLKEIKSFMVFLEGLPHNSGSGCIPCIIHTVKIYADIILVSIIEYGNLSVSNNLFDVFFALQKTKNVQMPCETDNLKQTFENLETYIKHTIDAFKKVKYNNIDIDEATKTFSIRWEGLKKRYLEYFKTNQKDLMLKIESNLPKFEESLRTLFEVTIIQNCDVTHGQERVGEIINLIEEKLFNFRDFLTVKSQTNFSMTSYLEDFPGLIHFIHIDRSNGRVTTPNIDFTGENSMLNLKEKVWSMVEFSQQYLNKGHLSIMWKDIAFNYTYFVWFEDLNGMPIKPKQQAKSILGNLKPQLPVGVLAGNFYHRLIETGFPKTNASKVKCYEIYCIHLGLVTATCVLEHCRRLAATINDIVGMSRNPADIL